MATSEPVPALMEMTCTGPGRQNMTNGARDEGCKGQCQRSGLEGPGKDAQSKQQLAKVAKWTPREQPAGRTGQRVGNSPGRGQRIATLLRWKEIVTEGKKPDRGGATRHGGTGTWDQAARLWLFCRGFGLFTDWGLESGAAITQ